MDGSDPNPRDSERHAGRSEDVVSTMDIHKVLSLLPHRYPFLLVDKVIDYRVNEYLTALKNVSFLTKRLAPGRKRAIRPSTRLKSMKAAKQSLKR